MDEDDLMNVMEVSKQIEVSNVDDNLTVESDGIEQQINLNKDIIKQKNEVESDEDGINDVPKVVMEDVTDDSLFLLSKDEGRMGTYVEKLKILLDEVKADMPNPPSRNTGDVIGGIFSISKPNQVDVKNLTKAVNKGEHLKKGERLKSEREKALKVRAKAMKVCGYCNAKTNEHTKTTYPNNPKARKKKKATPIIDV
ncbi:hypothetical protein Tco_1073867 [Tanacetum coccineum]